MNERSVEASGEAEIGSLAEFAQDLRSGRASAESTTRALLARIAERNNVLEAFTFVDETRALAAARAADLLVKAHVDLGPLMGVPIALKDLYAVDGMPLDAGSRVDVSDLLPAQGTIVNALARAGAVLLGKTRTTEFAFGTFNPTHPTPWNPCDLRNRRMPGGSSSGSAVAVAANLCPVAFGTDTGGSVRQPAALCGIVGFKASIGRVAMDGVFPLSPTFDSPGWFARSVADIALVWQALTGECPARERRIDTLVLGRPDAHFFDALEDEVARAFELALQRLVSAGARIVSVSLPSLADLDAAFGAYLSAELVGHLGRERVVSSLAQMDPVVAARIAPGLTLTAEAFVALRERFAAVARLARAAMRDVDALVTPTSPRVAAPVAGHEDPTVAAAWSRETLRFTRPGNLFGMCGVSLPIGHLAGSLPVGLQLLAQGGADGELLALARSVERALA